MRFAIVFFLLLAPSVLFAQQGGIASVYGEALSQQAAQGLVTCSGFSDCNFCTLAEMVNNIINWLFGFLTVVAVLVLAAAGFKLVTAGGNQEAMRWAKERFTYVIIGFLLMFASWLIVDTILRGLTGSEQGMSVWGSFDTTNCGFMAGTNSREYSEYEVDHSYENDIASQTGGGPDDGLRGSGSVQLSGNLVDVNGRLFDSAVVSNVTGLADEHGLRISGGHRTADRNRQVNGSPTSHHLSGRAADYVGSRAQMEAAAADARARGAIEVLIHDAGSGTHLHVAW